MELPKMTLCRQRFPRETVPSTAETLASLMNESWIPGKVLPGQTVAITGGSRGIAAIVPLTQAMVVILKGLGARPFVVNAMGSHGAATAEGQKELLTSLGMTKENLGCPVTISMEVDQVGELPDGFPVLCDRNAARADHIIVINRIKAHTAVTGPIQSGLCKMCTVGLGKVAQASRIHRYGPSHMGRIIRDAASMLIEKTPVLAGVGIVENAYGEVARLELVRPQEIPATDERLLVEMHRLMAKLPCPELDLLVIEEMGKRHSGSGIDTHVTGRWRIWGEPEPESPRIQRIAVLGLDPSSHGNAQGVGLADLITERLFNQIDRQKTYMNSLTSTYVQRGMIPVIGGSDRETIKKALYSIPLIQEGQLRVAWITDTNHIEEIALSPAALCGCGPDARPAKLREIDWKFDETGRIIPWGKEQK
ncbi:MAG: lactate racemase domain-containing protein [Deltaproteobacteria bacterium]|nr:lactate racemase domain-containing protein [Deltaproteobacteria bacterium]